MVWSLGPCLGACTATLTELNSYRTCHAPRAWQRATWFLSSSLHLSQCLRRQSLIGLVAGCHSSFLRRSRTCFPRRANLISLFPSSRSLCRPQRLSLLYRVPQVAFCVSWRSSRCVAVSLFSLATCHPLHTYARQKAARNKGDVTELKASFSRLLDMLQGPLQDSSSCPPALRQRIESLAESVHSCHLHVSGVMSDAHGR